MVPSHDLVVATTAGDLDMQGVLDRVWDLLPRLSDQPLPPDPDAHGALRERLAGLAHPVPAGREGEGVPSLVGRDLVLRRPVGPVRGLRIDGGPDHDVVRVRTTRGEVTLRAGHGRWLAQEAVLPSEHGGPWRALRTLVSVDLPEPGAYRVTVRAVTTPFRWVATVRVTQDGAATLVAEQHPRQGRTSTGEVPLDVTG